uniref:1-acyl-sn-glycerol-3-phosphate acyltransferase n=1 Tax=Trichocoleus desertorum TaxID=1481672 RepID=UPI0025B45735|nr:1-acyl-sn-glycerol-3-phosphate acyltransferase [Trichocoleus desertorum]
MPSTIDRVQPPLEFIPPAFNPWVLRLTQGVLPLWLRSRTAITQIQASNVEELVDCYRQFQAGKIRFLMAFRHPSTEDPFCMAHLHSSILPRVAKQQGVALQHPIHAHFIYDRGIPLWAGSKIGWLYSRLGGTPIHRGKVDRMGLRSARNLFVDGKLPMAAAPEGATNGHNEVISPLEPGVAQLGFWCVEDLLKANRLEQVLIVPIGIQYRYVEAPWQQIEQLMSQLEADSGLSGADSSQSANTANIKGLQGREAALYHRLYRLGEHVLTLMEEFYTRFYHRTPPAQAMPDPETKSPEQGIFQSDQAPISQADQAFTRRLRALLDTALQVAEQYFDLHPKGSLIDRCRRLEQAGWDRIYREDFKNPESVSLLERGLADRVAEEANLRMWHMRLVESFVAVTGRYVLEKPTAERFAETTLLMWDMISRIKGNSPFQRPQLGKQTVQMTIGQPISVTERWGAYSADRRGAKQAIADLTQDLQIALENMIQ